MSPPLHRSDILSVPKCVLSIAGWCFCVYFKLEFKCSKEGGEIWSKNSGFCYLFYGNVNNFPVII